MTPETRGDAADIAGVLAIHACRHDMHANGPCVTGLERGLKAAAALIASPQFARIIAEAKGEALREAADLSAFFVGHDGYTKAWLRARAAALTEDARGEGS